MAIPCVTDMYEEVINTPRKLNKAFAFIPRKTVNGDWIFGKCYTYNIHHRGGADTEYASIEDAMAMVLNGTAEVKKY